MQFDIIIPTRGNIPNLTSILSCISQQSLLPQRIIIVVNTYTGPILQLQGLVIKELSKNIYEKIDWHIIPVTDKKSGNASYARNIGCSLALSEYVYCIDDDNIFSSDFFARTVAEYLSYTQDLAKDIIYSPTIIRRDTDIIQSRGFRIFHYRLGRAEPIIATGKKITYIHMISKPKIPHTYGLMNVEFPCMMGGNSLFGPKNVFDTFPFDENMPFVYEDIDCTYRMVQSGIPLIVSKKNIINHMERDKTILEKSFVGNTDTIYQKAKNRILFVKKNATLRQKCQFFILGNPLSFIRFVVFIIKYGKKDWYPLLRSYMKGIQAGMKRHSNK